MKCPVCKEQLRLSRNDESSNPDAGVTYDRKIYVCDKDDVWASVEVPKTQ